MSPKADIEAKRRRLVCCGGERCHSGCFVRGNGCIYHNWLGEQPCPCAPGKGGARPRSSRQMPDPTSDTEEDLCGSQDTDTAGEEPEVIYEEEEGPSEKIQCLDADWLPLSSQPVPKRKAKSRGLIDFTKEIYSVDAGRLTGEAKAQVLNLAVRLRVQPCHYDLWLSYSFFLLHCIFRMTGAWDVGDVVRSRWIGDGGLGSLTQQEDAYFNHSVPSMDSSQRRRSPFATSLYGRLRSWHASGPERRALQLWMHLVCIMYYVGDPLFIEEVIFKQSPLEPSGLASHFTDFLSGQIDDYAKKLAEHLKLYALTRQSAKRWFNFNDGTRLAAGGSPRLSASSRPGPGTAVGAAWKSR